MLLFLNEKDSKLSIRISFEYFSSYGNIKVIPLYSIADLLPK